MKQVVFHPASHDVIESMKEEGVELPPNEDIDITQRAGYIRFVWWYCNAGLERATIPVETAKKLIRIHSGNV